MSTTSVKNVVANDKTRTMKYDYNVSNDTQGYRKGIKTFKNDEEYNSFVETFAKNIASFEYPTTASDNSLFIFNAAKAFYALCLKYNIKTESEKLKLRESIYSNKGSELYSEYLIAKNKKIKRDGKCRATTHDGAYFYRNTNPDRLYLTSKNNASVYTFQKALMINLISTSIIKIVPN